MYIVVIVRINLLCLLLHASSYPVVSIILSIIVVQKTSQLDVSYGLRLQRNLNIITAYSIVYVHIGSIRPNLYRYTYNILYYKCIIVLWCIPWPYIGVLNAMSCSSGMYNFEVLDLEHKILTFYKLILRLNTRQIIFIHF